MARPDKWKPEFVRIAECACKLGATDQEIADMLGVAVRTIYNWRSTRPEFAAALVAGKEEADARVERSLFQRAIGYEQDEVKIFMPGGSTEPVYAPYRARIAPDTTACIFWLKNRKPEEWRDKQALELSGKDGGPIQTEDVTRDAEEFTRRVSGLAARAAESGGTGGTDTGGEG